jgi:isoquinoline 1-oxidoreductase subunit beta
MTTPTLPLRRREFLGAAGGFTLAFVLPGAAARRAGPASAAAADVSVNSWLTIGTDNSVSLTVGSSDMGQGSFAGLGQILAEDLMVDPTRIRLVQGGPTTTAPAPLGSAIFTAASSVVRNNYWRLRDAAAVAREMLVTAAMNRYGDVTRANYGVSDGVVTHAPSGSRWTYGELAADAARLTPPSSAPLVPDAEFRSIGRSIPRADIPAKVDGSAVYGLDVRLPGMLFAVIRHGPTFGSTLAALPRTPRGVEAIVPCSVVAQSQRGTERTGAVNAVAVVGHNTWEAFDAAIKLPLRWNRPLEAAQWSDAAFLEQARALVTGATPFVPGGPNPPGTVYTVERSADDPGPIIDRATKVVNATYTLPYLPHVTMEPPNCTVDYVEGQRCDVYVPTQVARDALTTTMAITGMTAQQVTIHTTLLGGGMGRKLELDFIAQAVQVGMALKRPVLLMWPRNQDFTRDQYRPMALVSARAGLDEQGRIVGWQYRNISPSILAQRGVVLGATGDSQGWEGSQALPYDFGARRTEYVTHPAPIPIGFFRSVGCSINTFAVESFVDELALAAGADPYQFRRARLTSPRWIAVLDAAAAAAGWGTPVPGGGARGIAIGTAFNSICAQVVEVAAVTRTEIRVRRVSAALDCTIAVNPASVRTQITGGVVNALNATLWGRQPIEGGTAQLGNFNRSRMMLLPEMPEVSVSLIPNPAVLDRRTPIGGVGEVGFPALAPALANAVAALTGQRRRDLPFFGRSFMRRG